MCWKRVGLNSISCDFVVQKLNLGLDVECIVWYKEGWVL